MSGTTVALNSTPSNEGTIPLSSGEARVRAGRGPETRRTTCVRSRIVTTCMTRSRAMWLNTVAGPIFSYFEPEQLWLRFGF